MKKLPKIFDSYLKNATVTTITIGCSDTIVYRIEKNQKVYYLKIGKISSLTKEYHALIWLQNKLEVPEVEKFFCDGEKEYLLTKAIKGKMSCDDEYLKTPEKTIKLLAQAIKKLQSIKIDFCPFSANLDYKLGIATYNVKNKLLTMPIKSKIGIECKSFEKLLKYLKENRPTEELVFSHGDASLPNIFLDNQQVSGFIDVGECGIADKWYDIAIVCKSIKRNFENSEKLIKLFLQELNLSYSPKIEYYEAVVDLFL